MTLPPSVIPYLLTPSASALIDFLTNVFGAEELFRMHRPDGSVQHAQVKIGGSIIMLGEPREPFKPMPSSNYVYVEDADAVFNKAIAAGASVVIPIADQFYGDRMGGVRDPQGNLWWIATRKEEVPLDELTNRAARGAEHSK